MARGGRELFPPDRALQVRMAVAFSISLMLLAALVGFAVWFGAVTTWWAPLVILVLLSSGLIGASAPTGIPYHPSRLAWAKGQVEPVVERLAALGGVRPPRVEIENSTVPLSWTSARGLGSRGCSSRSASSSGCPPLS